ncbi:MAG: 5,6-dimethylbenzimidazole synthase [Oceanicoccus sp.]|uniref:5,6-dimethylbenzimidazole synthase n=1 Tax=Oceanicoccus sp. TaxID=2691044 RepID=UPI002629B32B|nr:5,6-dimethylbenzimidazole synthase [Oceanicoccus sp.]MCP3906614.1 5,6-dimethylbenzimidazole synthase [Oceanicoccus sp.]
MPHEFPEDHKQAVYNAIYQRRDMRHFLSAPVDPDVVNKLLAAAHAAPSVGMMQPWRFMRISDPAVRQSLHQLVEQERIKTAKALQQREDEFMQLKVEGIMDCGELLVVGLMDKRDNFVFGRRTLPEMDLASVSCAIQNMWLAARAEGLGLGWVSMFDPGAVRELLAMPDDTKPVAILCLGHVEKFYDAPMLEQEGWIKSGKLDNVVMDNGWQEDKASDAHQRD